MTRTIFNDGSKEEKYLREAIITPMATLEKTGTASNYSVRLRAGANYDVVHVGFVDYFKVTKFWAAGTLLDGQCRMTRLTSWRHARGPGSDSYPVYDDSYLTPCQ